ncbi:NAD-dependent epimerase/dehydratase family protein [Taibaiella soli]|uniref:NAD-dependent dehydratase n=1 Tax=Taibaiella soli TaxID=1649169 RepID=A0A2W2BG29_9BACT|nr:NAD-dependent epimerase/dehydratase family protein [Taibaiella soli]PZF72446.1 NAD-dependent dehydratase [Taibaiella soli]
MQTILGAGGAIGLELAKALPVYTTDIRLVSRNPQKVNDTDELYSADLTNRDNVFAAIKGSKIVYLVTGFEYDLDVWRATWPVLMRNVIDACTEYKAKLVFFDNVYMYDIDAIGHMTEQSPMKPPSKKGQVRKQLVNMIFKAVDDAHIEAVIARAADFYGPGNKTSVLLETVYKNLQKGKAAQLLAAGDKIHTYTFTPDAAKATALLGNTPDAYNQVWHLPTDPQRLTGKDWVALFAEEMNVKPKSMVVPKWMVKMLGWFMPIMREMYEMLYQNDRDYFFDSTKFEQRFNIKATPYKEGVKQVIQHDR